jgi:hypothetical protein
MRARLIHLGTGLLELAVASVIILVYWRWPAVPEWLGGKGFFAILGIAALLAICSLGSFYSAIRPNRKPPSPDETAP